MESIVPEQGATARGWSTVGSVKSRTTVETMPGKLHLTIRYTDAGEGWVTAQVTEIPGAISEGKTRAEARANVLDALEVLLTPDDQLTDATTGDDSELLTLTVAS